MTGFCFASHAHRRLMSPGVTAWQAPLRFNRRTLGLMRSVVGVTSTCCLLFITDTLLNHRCCLTDVCIWNVYHLHSRTVMTAFNLTALSLSLTANGHFPLYGEMPNLILKRPKRSLFHIISNIIDWKDETWMKLYSLNRLEGKGV